MLALMLSAVLSQAPLPGGPGGLALPGYRLHLVVDEALDPDRLDDWSLPLTKGSVVLWLQTSGNTLRDSTAERLRRYSEVHVGLSPPLKPDAVRALERAVPRAYAWVGRALIERPADAALLRGRRVSLELEGELSESLFRAAQALRPARTVWRPTGTVSVLEWMLFRQLPGKRWVTAFEGRGECQAGAAREPARWWALAQSRSGGSFPCGAGARVAVPPDLSDEALARLYAGDPAVELEVFVGADERVAGAARRLLERLESSAPEGD